MRRPRALILLVLIFAGGGALGAFYFFDAFSWRSFRGGADTGLRRQGRATVFWAGEEANEKNVFIANHASVWDANWQEHYGGVDDPVSRCGYKPCAFSPAENPFYAALPYNDLDKEGKRKESAAGIPWFLEEMDKKSVLKNRWIEVMYRGAACYGQWEDVGPFEEDDFEYVFGDAGKPKNTWGAGAGIDLSPAMRDCLKLEGNDMVVWRFVGEGDVSEGPWKEIVTTRDVGW